MRLDKFLKVSRLIKRRTVANEACDGGRVVKPGDVIEIRFGERTLRVEVASVGENTSKADAPAMYREL